MGNTDSFITLMSFIHFSIKKFRTETVSHLLGFALGFERIFSQLKITVYEDESTARSHNFKFQLIIFKLQKVILKKTASNLTKYKGG